MKTLTFLLAFSLSFSIDECQNLSDTLSLPLDHVLPQNITSAPWRNLTSSEPDPRFRIAGRYGDQNVDAMSLLMNAVSLQAVLAYQVFGTKIKEVSAPVLPEYKDVQITIVPNSPFKSFHNCLAIWGLYAAMREMTIESQFREARFFLFWEDAHTAFIRISKPPAPSNLISNLGANPTTSSITIQADNPGIAVRCGFDPNALGLSFAEVFLTVLSTLRTLAYWSESDVTYPFSCTAEGFNTILRVSFGGAQRVSPPYLLVGRVIYAVRQIPTCMISAHRFAEILIAIKFDNKFIGYAALHSSQSQSQLISAS